MKKVACGRLLYPQICQSRRVGRLGSRGALIYSWLLTGCDDQGRIAGDAVALKAKLAPFMDDLTPQDIEEALTRMHQLELVIRYEDDGEALTQVRNWWRWQGGLPRKRPSNYPPPPLDDDCWYERLTGLVWGEDMQGNRKLKYAERIGPGMEVTCPQCEQPATWVKKGHAFCVRCLAELLPVGSRPKFGPKNRMTETTAIDRVHDALKEHGPMSIQQLVDRLSFSKRTIAEALAKLNRLGVIERHPGNRSKDPSTYEYLPAPPTRCCMPQNHDVGFHGQVAAAAFA